MPNKQEAKRIVTDAYAETLLIRAERRYLARHPVSMNTVLRLQGWCIDVARAYAEDFVTEHTS
jgi:hypothetical protein